MHQTTQIDTHIHTRLPAYRPEHAPSRRSIRFEASVRGERTRPTRPAASGLSRAELRRIVAEQLG